MSCSRKGLENNCPKSCRDVRTHTCGNGCSALLAQRLPRARHSSCWAVGQWGGGRKVSVSLLDASDPGQGIVYTMLQGDSKGCPGGAQRTLSVAVRCPGVGMAQSPVMNMSSLGNCAYAASMVHPAACPITQDSLSRRDQLPGYYGITQGSGRGSTGETMMHLLGSLLGLLGLYLCVGAAWRYSQLGMRGVEVIPHLSFWREVPGHVARAVAAAEAEMRGLADPSLDTGVPNEGGMLVERASGGAAQPLLGIR